MLVDFLVDPDDVSGLKTLLRWVDRAARAEDSDKIRCCVMHGTFRRVLRRNGYFNVKSSIEVAVKVNAVQVPRGFYDDNTGTLPDHVAPPGGAERDSTGFEISPSAALVWSVDQTTVTLGRQRIGLDDQRFGLPYGVGAAGEDFVLEALNVNLNQQVIYQC